MKTNRKEKAYRMLQTWKESTNTSFVTFFICKIFDGLEIEPPQGIEIYFCKCNYLTLNLIKTMNILRKKHYHVLIPC